MKVRFRWMIALSLYELLRYDIGIALSGFYGICGRLRSWQGASGETSPALVHAIRDANSIALTLYSKKAACFQRSVALAQVLRRFGVGAQVVIAYQAQPFFSHAWVEVNGEAINDSRSYQRMLHVIDRM